MGNTTIRANYDVGNKRPRIEQIGPGLRNSEKYVGVKVRLVNLLMIRNFTFVRLGLMVSLSLYDKSMDICLLASLSLGNPYQIGIITEHCKIGGSLVFPLKTFG